MKKKTIASVVALVALSSLVITSSYAGQNLSKPDPNVKTKEVVKTERVKHPCPSKGHNALGGRNWGDATRVKFIDGTTKTICD